MSFGFIAPPAVRQSGEKVRHWLTLSGRVPHRRKERRRHPRHAINSAVRVHVEGASGSFWASGRCVEISESGIRIEIPEAIPVRGRVNFVIDAPPLQGSGLVRHCARHGLKHVIGVEFSGGLRWDSSSLELKHSSQPVHSR